MGWGGRRWGCGTACADRRRSSRGPGGGQYSLQYSRRPAYCRASVAPAGLLGQPRHAARLCSQPAGCARCSTSRCRLSATPRAGRCERVRANLGTTRARGEVDMEITLRKMQHKEDKMQRTASQFQEMEQTVYNSLFTLIKDTSVLRDYAAAALLIVNVSVCSARGCCCGCALAAAATAACQRRGSTTAVVARRALQPCTAAGALALLLAALPRSRRALRPPPHQPHQTNARPPTHTTTGVLQRGLRVVQPGARAVLQHRSSRLRRGQQVRQRPQGRGQVRQRAHASKGERRGLGAAT